ncbi:MAG: diguanylate cyclase, partial [Actinomycetes bacterium]
ADVIARIGGDEFAALLVDFDSESSVAIQRFQSGIAAASLDRGTQGLAVSAALGVASYDPRSGKTLEDLMRLADQDMYLDKLTNRESVNPS